MSATLHGYPIKPKEVVWVISDKSFLAEVVSAANGVIVLRPINSKRTPFNIDYEGCDLTTRTLVAFWHDPRTIIPPKDPAIYSQWMRVLEFFKGELGG